MAAVSQVERLLHPGGRGCKHRRSTEKRRFTVEHICHRCSLFYQMPLKAIGITYEDAAKTERWCVECEQKTDIYNVYGGEVVLQEALF